MPYVIVEVVGDTGCKEVVTVPEPWLVNKTQVIGYLHWPNETDDRLKALLADEHSVPQHGWEKRMYKLLLKHIKSIAMSEKIMASMRMGGEDTSVRIGSSNERAPQVDPNVIPKKEPEEAEEDGESFGSIDSTPKETIPNEPAILDTGRECLSHSSDEEEYDPFNDESTAPEKEEKITVVNVDQLSADAQQLFTSLSAEQDGQNTPQLQDMINELKCMMINNQTEIKKMVSNSLIKIHHTFYTLLHKINSITSDKNECFTSDLSVPNVEFEYEIPLTSLEAVEAFEKRLMDKDYRNNIHTWAECNVGCEESSQHRMHIMLDLIFDRQLFAKFSWAGLTDKYPLKDFRNIFQLFEYIGSINSHRITREEVKHFFMKKLKLAESRKDKIFKRKSTPRLKKQFKERVREWEARRARKRQYDHATPSSPTVQKRVEEQATSTMSLEMSVDDEIMDQVENVEACPFDDPVKIEDVQESMESSPEASPTDDLIDVGEDNSVKSLTHVKVFEVTENNELKFVGHAERKEEAPQPKANTSQPKLTDRPFSGFDAQLQKSVPKGKVFETSASNGSNTARIIKLQREVRQPESSTSLPPSVGKSVPVVNPKNPKSFAKVSKNVQHKTDVRTSSTTFQRLPAIQINPITSFAQMQGFESALNDEKRKTQVYRWIDRTVGSIVDNRQRLKVLLERLIDQSFLKNFCWSKRTNILQRSLAPYRNFIQLFAYACRTRVQGSTIIYNHALVSTFFSQTLNANSVVE